MGKRDKSRKQAKPDYIYQCQSCNGNHVHRPEPSNEPCPLCEKRMSIIKIVNVPNIKPVDIKYPEEIKEDAMARILKLSEYGKLADIAA